MTLTEFLLARIAEDEAVARVFDWAKPDQYYVEGLEASGEYVTCYISPARVLAECEAKRQIVAMHKPGVELCYWSHDSSAVHDDDPCLTLRLLALPYADHSGFLPEWQPDPVNAKGLPTR